VSASYRAVGWNPQKKRYDATIGFFVAALLVTLIGGGAMVNPNATIETLLIRALAVTAFLLLHIVLSIGPLCRLDRRFLPLLYNRRHLGVTMFAIALAHGMFALVQFHALGNRNPLVSVLTTSTAYGSVSEFPFQVLGLAALGILFLMAATSHDFWLHNLTPPVWKALHMAVYAAYALVVAHVALGALQSERSPWLAGVLCVGVAWVVGLHLAAAFRERRVDDADPVPGRMVDVCAVSDIPDTRAVVRCMGGERVAVFKYGDRISAISNVCQHQNGPLGEGKIVNGCVVCPWHGYEYRPDTGASPPPFTEKVATFTVRVRDGRVLVDPRPHAPGTRVEPARIA
jgi:sulfoxide reductase heme-binding subunit YedZ